MKSDFPPWFAIITYGKKSLNVGYYKCLWFYFSLSHVCVLYKGREDPSSSFGCCAVEGVATRISVAWSTKEGKKICLRATLLLLPFCWIPLHSRWTHQQMNLLLISSVLCMNGSSFFVVLKSKPRSKKPSKPFPAPCLVKCWGHKFSVPVGACWEAVKPVRAGKVHH